MNFKNKSQLFIGFPFIYFKNSTFWSQRFTVFYLKYSFCRQLDSGDQGLLSNPATLQVQRLFFSLIFFYFFFFFFFSFLHGCINPTNSKQQSPSWRVETFSNCQDIPMLYKTQILQNRVQNSPPPVPIPSQITPVHAFPSYLFKIYSSIILPLTPRSSSCFLSSHTPEGIYFLHSMCYTHRPTLSPWFNHPSTLWRGTQILKLLIVIIQFPINKVKDQLDATITIYWYSNLLNMFRKIFLSILRSARLCFTACGIIHSRCCRPVAWNAEALTMCSV